MLRFRDGFQRRFCSSSTESKNISLSPRGSELHVEGETAPGDTRYFLGVIFIQVIAYKNMLFVPAGAASCNYSINFLAANFQISALFDIITYVLYIYYMFYILLFILLE